MCMYVNLTSEYLVSLALEQGWRTFIFAMGHLDIYQCKIINFKNSPAIFGQTCK